MFLLLWLRLIDSTVWWFSVLSVPQADAVLCQSVTQQGVAFHPACYVCDAATPSVECFCIISKLLTSFLPLFKRSSPLFEDFEETWCLRINCFILWLHSQVSVMATPVLVLVAPL